MLLLISLHCKHSHKQQIVLTTLFIAVVSCIRWIFRDLHISIYWFGKQSASQEKYHSHTCRVFLTSLASSLSQNKPSIIISCCHHCPIVCGGGGGCWKALICRVWFLLRPVSWQFLCTYIFVSFVLHNQLVVWCKCTSKVVSVGERDDAI